MPPKTSSSLTPYISSVWANFTQELHQLLGLPDTVTVRYQDYDASFLKIELLLPNKSSLELSIEGWQDKAPAHNQKDKGFWIQNSVWFGSVHNQNHALSERFLVQSLIAIKKFITQEQRNNSALLEQLVSLIQSHKKYHKIHDDYYRRIFVGVTGMTANIRLGFRCNQDCHFCWQSRGWPDPPEDLYFIWLDELHQLGVQQVVFTGGEPTLFKRFVELLLLAKEKYGMRTLVQTNATTLSNPRYLQRIQQAKVNRLFISFHSSDAEISDKMTRAPKTFAMTVKGIEAALAAGMRVGLNCIVEKDNYQGLAQQAQFIVDRFVLPFPENPIESMNYSRPQHYFDEEKWAEQLIPLDLVYPQLKQAIEILDAKGVLLDVTAGSCGLSACLLRFKPELIYLPKEEHMGMADPKHSQQFREKFICSRCTLFSQCQGPGMKYHELFGDRGLIPFTEALSVAQDFPLSL